MPPKKVVVKLDPMKIDAFTKLGKPVPESLKVYGVRKKGTEPVRVAKREKKTKPVVKIDPKTYGAGTSRRFQLPVPQNLKVLGVRKTTKQPLPMKPRPTRDPNIISTSRRKSKPIKDAKTIPQQIIRQNLIEGGVSENQRLRQMLISGEADMTSSSTITSQSAGVLSRNIMGGAPTIRGDTSTLTTDKRRRAVIRQKTQNLDINNPKDLTFLEKRERQRLRNKNLEKITTGKTLDIKYYGKERKGKVIKVIKYVGGRATRVSMEVDGLGVKNVDIKNIM